MKNPNKEAPESLGLFQLLQEIVNDLDPLRIAPIPPSEGKTFYWSRTPPGSRNDPQG